MAGLKTIATLEGFPLLGSASEGWEFTAGTAPSIRTFDLAPDAAANLLQRAKAPVTLVLTSNDKTITIKNLWVIGAAPSDSPGIGRITVADRRWFWKYAHVVRRYNMTRRTGVQRVTSLLPAQLQQSVDTVQYREWSLNNPKAGPAGRWTASQILHDVIQAVGEIEREYTASTPTATVGDVGRQLPIERLQLDDAGDAAIDRVLAYLPEAVLFVDAAGAVQVFGAATGGEQTVIEKVRGPELHGRGRLQLAQNAQLRPKEIRVYFTREVELRFDFLEARRAADTVAVAEDRRIENVLPVPDFQITMSGALVPQGTWVTFDAYLNAITSETRPPNSQLGGVKIDHDLLERAFAPHATLWGALALLGVRDPDPDWTARIAALQRHWRRTFRVNRKWMDRILKLSAYRVASIDQVSGQRAAAEAYCDYTLIPGRRHHWKQASAASPMTHSMAIRGYPQGADAGGVNTFDAETRPAPAEVSVVDEDQGIITLDFQVDPNRLYEQVIPSLLDTGAVPQWNLKDQTSHPTTFDELIALNRPVRMSSQWKVATILTAIPAAPNSKHQLHRVTVKPSDLSDFVPAHALTAAIGPPMEIRIGANVETARFAWKDNERDLIDEMFGIDNLRPADTRDLSDRARGLCVNDLQNNKGAASLWDIARAAAARVYASLADRYVGTAAGPLEPGVIPAGAIRRVAHEIDAQGVGTTTIDLPERVPQIDLLSYLPDSARAIILREVPR